MISASEREEIDETRAELNTWLLRLGDTVQRLYEEIERFRKVTEDGNGSA